MRQTSMDQEPAPIPRPMPPTITRLLIATRGELAARVIERARLLELECVAVYSDADVEAWWLKGAQSRVRIGGGPPADSYLNIPAILRAAALCGADAVYPGYGFLSERADFAQACADAGLYFVGPSVAAMQSMADKAQAKATMRAAGVPVLPGLEGEQQRLLQGAEALGYPLLVKALGGGGGRGMRRVDSAPELAPALHAAAREARLAFGHEGLMLERLLQGARHVEVQILADHHGNVHHLGERDCSTQRRRQKVLEESPAPGLSPELRAALCESAVQAARAVDYVGAGTVEFLVKGETYYFLEMNTRLQVEYGVSEMVSTVDIVLEQLRIALGRQIEEPPRPRGHAMQARVYAEDPYQDYLPQTGTLLHQRAPAGPGVRADLDLRGGMSVGTYYDPMLGRVLTWGRTREQCMRRLRGALGQLELVGPVTNQRWLRSLLRRPELAQGALSTDTLDSWKAKGDPLFERTQPSALDWALAAWLRCTPQRPWFRSSGHCELPIVLRCEGVSRRLRVQPGRGAQVQGAGETGDSNTAPECFSLRMLQSTTSASDALQGQQRLHIDGLERSVLAWLHSSQVWLDSGEGLRVFEEPAPHSQSASDADPGRCCSPMAGTLSAVEVSVGQSVVLGDTLARVEAMKLETRVRALRSGVVVAIHQSAGAQLQAGALILELGDAL